MTRTDVLHRGWTAKLRERLTLVEERARRGYTVDEIAESIGRSRRGVKDDLERVRALQTEQFRRERARERARTFALCAQTQAALWEVIERQIKAGDDKAVPAAARALLETIRMGETLRNADEKDVEQGQLTVRDIFEEMDTDYLDEPVALVEAEVESGRADDSGGASPAEA
jgi:predicted transcriptional regulator